MPDVAVRRLGVALIVSATVFTMGTAFAANLNLTDDTNKVGAGNVTISSPCTSVAAAPTFAYVTDKYEVNTVVLTGIGCAGTLTVEVTLNNGGAGVTINTPGVDSADINAGYTVDFSGSHVTAQSFVGLAVLITN